MLLESVRYLFKFIWHKTNQRLKVSYSQNKGIFSSYVQFFGLFHPADPRVITYGGLPGIQTQL